MKLKKILLGLAYMSVMASCADLDYHEYTVYDKDYVFTDFGRTGAVVTNIYSYLDYDLPSEVSYCSACDEAQFAWSWSSIHDWINGAWSSTNSHSLWNYYSGIRDANFFLEESQNADFSELKEDKNYVAEMNRFNRYKYEVRFLRAYFYFNLVRAYGDIPLVTKVLTEEEANQVKRTPAAEVFDFIIKECDEIADELPVDYSKLENDAANGESPETGRITKQAVLALKARTLLYQASPLFNIANDVNLWKQAALASKKVIDFCAENGIKMGKYSELWGTDNWKASEMIFVRRIGDTSSPEYTNFPVGMENGGSGNCPTQTLVDAYEMKVTGKAWDEPESGYDPNKPYDNRDPRMEMTIAVNGVPYVETEEYPGFPTDLQSLYLAAAMTLEGKSCICENVFEDRLRTAEELQKMGGTLQICGKWLTAEKSRLHGAEVVSQDLRGGAALVSAALAAEGFSTIRQTELIERGYERFPETLRELGAKIIVEKEI